MAAALEQALSTTSEERFDFFINYRVWADGTLANALFKLGSALKVGAGKRRCRIYLDKVRLLDGARFDVGFTIGLAKSLVFAPLMSRDCLKSLTKLGEEDRVDFVLAEYIMAAALHTRSIVKAIMPVIVNEQPDGTHHEVLLRRLLVLLLFHLLVYLVVLVVVLVLVLLVRLVRLLRRRRLRRLLVLVLSWSSSSSVCCVCCVCWEER
eukprot:SAG11_NODE_8624_length_994_cov_1.612291_1_plen_207_part_10